MSTSAYYNFIHNAAANDKTLARAAAAAAAPAAPAANPIETRRQAAISPSSFATSSSSNSSSSLNQFNSLTSPLGPNVLATQASIPYASSSSASPSSNSPASLTNSIAASSLSMRSTTSSSSSATSSGVSVLRDVRQNVHNDHLERPASNNRNQFRNTSPSSNTCLHQQPRDLVRQSSVTPTKMSHSPLIHSYTLHSLEPKPLKPFRSRSAYLEAMKEDLAEWLNRLYDDLDLNTENFFSQLETGAIICRHANNVIQMGRNSLLEQSTNGSSAESSLNEVIDNSNSDHLNSPSPDYPNDEQRQQHPFNSHHNYHSTTSRTPIFTQNRQRPSLTNSLTSHASSRFSLRGEQSINWFEIKTIQFKKDAKPGTFFSRDNICQFILWCRSLDILECLLFETDDLVARKNEKSFVLCLLEVARIGFKVGMPTPLIIQLEQEIDDEIENDAKLQKELERDGKGNKEETKSTVHLGGHIEDSTDSDKNNNFDGSTSAKVASENDAQATNDTPSRPDLGGSLLEEEGDGQLGKHVEDEEEGYFEQDVGPKPQVITNDLLSLHEKVVQLLCQCTCATQFPMVRIGDGKYKVGDKLIIFVRILRRHIMVRVGGGWQELSEFLHQKDPCRSKNQLAGGYNQQPSSLLYHTHASNGVQQRQNSASSIQGLNGKLGTLTISTTPSTTKLSDANNGVSRSRFAGSSHHLNKGHHHSQHHHNNYNGKHSGVPRLISSSASMSWLSHNS